MPCRTAVHTSSTVDNPLMPLTTTTTTNNHNNNTNTHLPVAAVLFRHLATLSVEEGKQLRLYEADIVVVSGPLQERRHRGKSSQARSGMRWGLQDCQKPSAVAWMSSAAAMATT